MEFEPLPQLMFAVLVVYRQPGTDTPIHAIAAEIWQGQEKVAIVPAVHCVGMMASQVHQYVNKIFWLIKAWAF